MELSDEFLHEWNDTYRHSVHQLRRDAAASLRQIDFITEPISYEQFVRRYLVPNLPCIFSKTITHDWLSSHEWFCQDRSSIRWNFLTENFGERLRINANYVCMIISV